MKKRIFNNSKGKRYYKDKRKNTFLGLPKNTIVLSLFILIFFGLISTTFGAFSSNNITSQNDNISEVPHISTKIRTRKINNDLANSGANSDVAQLSAQYNYNWKGKVYFLVPEQWDISNYGHVQVDITRTTSTSSSNYQFYSGDMTRVGSSRLFYINLSIDHSSWGQNEYLAFTANSSTYGPGTFALSGNQYYTTPIDYGCNNSSNYYLFIPSTESQFTTTTNGNTISGSWNTNRSTLLKKTQTVNITTNGSSSASGGTVTMTGYYDTGDTTVDSSSATSSSTSVSYDGVEGTEMKLEAAPKSYYAFDGWYSGSTKLSSNATYTYNVYSAKTITAKFVDAKYTVTAGTCNGGTVSVTTSPATHSTGTTVTATASTGCTFSKWQDNQNGTFTSKTSSSTTFKPNSNATVAADFTLNKATVSNFVTQDFVVGNSYIPTATINKPCSSATITTTLRITDPHDSSVYNETKNNLSDHNYKPVEPGVYNVKLTVNSSAYTKLTSTSDEYSTTFTVRPPTPDLDISCVSATGTQGGSGTSGDPYIVPKNSTSFVITLVQKNTYDSLVQTYNGAYKWSPDNGTTWITPSENYGKTYTFSPDTSTENSPIKFITKIQINGVGGGNKSLNIYYQIVDDFLTIEEYNMPQNQLIFDNDDNPINYYLKIYSGKSSFKTQFLNSKTNISTTFGNLGNEFSGPSHTVATNYYDETFNLANIMINSGVYFLKANVKDSNNTLSSTTNAIKVVKGTSNYLSNRAIYFETNSADFDLNSYRLMICCSDSINSPSSGNTTWVTMHKLSSGTNRYKAYIPSSVSTLAFYVMKPDYYDTRNIINTESMIAYTQFISIDDDNNCFNATEFDTSSPIMMTGSFGHLS